MLDIEKLSSEELVDLHDRIMRRLRRLEKAEEIALKPLDLVFFKNQYALVLQVHQQTVDILCETKEKWRVFPSFLTKVEDSFENIKQILEKKFPDMPYQKDAS